jgi:hypothetical protein
MFGFSFTSFYQFLLFVNFVSLTINIPFLLLLFRSCICFLFISLLQYYFSLNLFMSQFLCLPKGYYLFHDAQRLIGGSCLSLCVRPPSVICGSRERFFLSDVVSGCWSLNWMLHDAVVFTDHCVRNHKRNWSLAEKSTDHWPDTINCTRDNIILLHVRLLSITALILILSLLAINLQGKADNRMYGLFNDIGSSNYIALNDMLISK